MHNEVEKDILKVLVSEEEIQRRVSELGEALAQKLAGKEPLFLGVLKGCFVFMADLVRACPLKCDVEFMALSSYRGGTVSSGRVEITQDLHSSVAGRDLVIVEDILDSGATLAFLKETLLERGAASITIVTLLDKPSRRTKAVAADLAGFTIPDAFVVGYGLDYDQKYRNIPYIGVLKPEAYSV
ncbi:MAG: hypoxanthine phosphoribosyltransferase [Oscillibacter sp.]|nr:hypoxanthine phosphoribosyltransferase [Oscillibacter sp.]MCI9376459.1 hypoxanthine phosphoribosyltransferase [Oscillibacter sp.]